MKIRSITLVVALMFVPSIACAKDYYLRLGRGKSATASIVLTQKVCGFSWLKGSAWRHSEVQISGPGHVFTVTVGCWERIHDKVYVLENIDPFWIAPDGTGGDEYYRLDTKSCNFSVPGVSFSGWRSGRGVAVDLKAKRVLIDQGPLCWRYANNWLEEIDQPMVYSAFEVRTSPLP